MGSGWWFRELKEEEEGGGGRCDIARERAPPIKTEESAVCGNRREELGLKEKDWEGGTAQNSRKPAWGRTLEAGQARAGGQTAQIVRVTGKASHEEKPTNRKDRRKVSKSACVCVCVCCGVCWSAQLSVSIWVPSVPLALALATLELTYVGMQTHARHMKARSHRGKKKQQKAEERKAKPHC